MHRTTITMADQRCVCAVESTQFIQYPSETCTSVPPSLHHFFWKRKGYTFAFLGETLLCKWRLNMAVANIIHKAGIWMKLGHLLEYHSRMSCLTPVLWSHLDLDQFLYLFLTAFKTLWRDLLKFSRCLDYNPVMNWWTLVMIQKWMLDLSALLYSNVFCYVRGSRGNCSWTHLKLYLFFHWWQFIQRQDKKLQMIQHIKSIYIYMYTHG